MTRVGYPSLAWPGLSDSSACPVCHREGCEGHPNPAEATGTTAEGGFADDELEDAVDVAREGQAIHAHGIRYVVDGIVPDYGLLGFHVGYTKAGKSTMAHALASAVASGTPFLDRATAKKRVFILAPEDPPEYTAWLVRDLRVPRGAITFRRLPLILSARELHRICATIQARDIGLVMIHSWQAVVRGLMRDENDNAAGAMLAETVKAATRLSKIPWIIDAHSGKGEDQGDDADPLKAMRGASALGGAADFTLSLRYGDGTFGTRRRFSGKGRFVGFTLTLDFDRATHRYSVIDDPKSVVLESTWRLICEIGALTETPHSAQEIARACGLGGATGTPTTTHRRQVAEALKGRPEVGRVDAFRRGQKTLLYRRLERGD